MNWLDIVFIVILVVMAWQGMKNGLLGTAFTVLGLYVGWLLAGQYAGDLGDVFADDLGNQSWVTFIAYAIIIFIALIATRIIWRIVKPLLTVLTLGLAGMVDTLGGLALGLVVGIALSVGLIVGLARLTYSFEELPSEGVAGQVVDRIPNVESTRENLEEALAESAIAPTVVDIMDKIPGSAFGLIPDDFGTAVDIFQQTMDELDAAKDLLEAEESS